MNPSPRWNPGAIALPDLLDMACALSLLHTILFFSSGLGLTFAQVGKTSVAARSMCLWVRAMEDYSLALHVVKPKRAKLQAAQAALDASNAELADKQQLLRSTRGRLVSLQSELAAAQKDAVLLNYQARTPGHWFVRQPWWLYSTVCAYGCPMH